jgi:hypothetical protein
MGVNVAEVFVGEDLGRRQQSQCHQRGRHRELVGEHQDDEDAEHTAAEPVRGHHDPPPVEPVRQHARVQAEDQRRRPSQQGGQRHQERVVGQRRHE